MVYATQSLERRLIDAEDEFLSARNATAVAAFEQKWEILCQDFRHALDAGNVDDDLDRIAQSVFLRIAILGESLAMAQEEADRIQTAAMTEIEDLLAQMTLGDIVQPLTGVSERATSRHTPVTQNQTSPALIPTFLALPYDWILRNVHNPYPTASLKSAMAREAGVSLHTVDSWFRSVRKHIGWLSFVKRRFNGSRALAIAAAKRILFQGSQSDDVSPEVAAELLSVVSKLQCLYPDHCTHIAPETSSLAFANICESSLSSSSSIDKSHTLPNVSSQPSPPSHPPSLIFTSDSEDESYSPSPVCATNPLPQQRRKRRRYEFTTSLAESNRSDRHEERLAKTPSAFILLINAIKMSDRYHCTRSRYLPDAAAPALSSLPRRHRRSASYIGPPTKRFRHGLQVTSKRSHNISNFLHPFSTDREGHVASRRRSLTTTELNSARSQDVAEHDLSPSKLCSRPQKRTSARRVVSLHSHNGQTNNMWSSGYTQLISPPVGPDLLRPESLMGVIDSILSGSLESSSSPSGEASTSLHLHPHGCGYPTSQSVPLSAKQREEFDLLLASTITSFPNFEGDLWDDAFDRPTFPLHSASADPVTSFSESSGMSSALLLRIMTYAPNDLQAYRHIIQDNLDISKEPALHASAVIFDVTS
uniref:A1 mating-type protein n=1 Tax=Phanerodontia chrysosporium TaxID=2822231 RepID=E7DAG8_PHACH|nr:A1 mating-type protein [Phanerodontia chrysosporium]